MRTRTMTPLFSIAMLNGASCWAADVRIQPAFRMSGITPSSKKAAAIAPFMPLRVGSDRRIAPRIVCAWLFHSSRSCSLHSSSNRLITLTDCRIPVASPASFRRCNVTDGLTPSVNLSQESGSLSPRDGGQCEMDPPSGRNSSRSSRRMLRPKGGEKCDVVVQNHIRKSFPQFCPPFG